MSILVTVRQTDATNSQTQMHSAGKRNMEKGKENQQETEKQNTGRLAAGSPGLSNKSSAGPEAGLLA